MWDTQRILFRISKYQRSRDVRATPTTPSMNTSPILAHPNLRFCLDPKQVDPFVFCGWRSPLVSVSCWVSQVSFLCSRSLRPVLDYPSDSLTHFTVGRRSRVEMPVTPALSTEGVGTRFSRPNYFPISLPPSKTVTHVSTVVRRELAGATGDFWDPWQKRLRLGDYSVNRPSPLKEEKMKKDSVSPPSQ